MAFDPTLVELKWENHSKNDEGDFDSYRTSIFTSTYISRKTGIYIAWGSEDTAVLSPDKKLAVLYTICYLLGGLAGLSYCKFRLACHNSSGHENNKH
mmetsp:Transcript_26054/g.49195  ORF Transcript_26054/g.49195 Transcript_26054/m.49195 type:complete len:97 (+) Transcript_26054:301-591(+)